MKAGGAPGKTKKDEYWIVSHETTEKAEKKLRADGYAGRSERLSFGWSKKKKGGGEDDAL